MPSYISELFNTDPYYDDFDKDKKFLRIMFRPGYGVQARELTQLQTILQNQIERFGNHVFEEGSIVTGGKISVNSLKYARVTGLSGTSDVDDFLGVIARGTQRSNAKIVHTEKGLSSSSVDNFNVIFFDYLEGGTAFTGGDVIGGTAADGSYITANITGSWSTWGPSPVGNALVVSVDEGVRFTEGFFVYHEGQKIGAYSLTGGAGSRVRLFDNPTSRVGFSVDKMFVDSDADTTLTDPAFGSYNYNAPGADRFLIDLNIVQYGFTATNTSAVDNFSRTDFIEFLRLVSGTPIKIEKYPDYAVLEDTLARRTYDESGNYTVRAFEANLVDGIGITNDGSTGAINVDLEPGKAYIFGYEFETQGVTRLELEAARTPEHTRTVDDISFNRTIGPYCRVQFSGISKSLTGFVGFTQQQQVRLDGGLSGSNLSQIGKARVRWIEPFNSASQIYNLHIYNVEMSGTASFDDVTRIFVDATGPSHAFAITGSAGLINQQNGDLLYVIPSGFRAKTVTDANYAISGFFEKTLTDVTASGATTFSINITDYTSDQANVQFSISTDPITIGTSEDIVVFDKNGVSIGGTAARDSVSNDILSLSLAGAGVTNNNKIYITTSIDVYDISSPHYRRNKSLVTEGITSGVGGFTGVFAGLSADDYGNTVLYLGGLVDVAEILSLTGFKDGLTQTINYFTFDSGQRDNIYDWSRLVMVSGTTGITGPFEATVRRYSRSGQRGPFTVDSYSSQGYSTIPDYTSRTTGKIYNLADVIDFRPDRGPSGDVINYPWFPINTVANDSLFSYDHYLSRTDKIVLNRDRTFSVVKGIPSIEAVTPPDDPNAMTLYSVTLNPYTYDKKDTSLRYVDNRRYTMRDIGDLEKRIEAVEYYTTLSLLEQEAKSLSITDENGVEMPKRGILVDQFKGHNIGDVKNPMYAASIDFDRNELRPPFETRVFGLSGPDGTKTNTLTVSTDGIITLPYTTRDEIAQPLSTSTTPINSSGIVNYLGTMTISPAGDYWFDTGLTPDVRVNVDGENDAWISGNGFGSQWNDWESIWYGREVQSESNTKPNTVTQNSISAITKGVNLGNTFKSGIPEGIKRKTNSKVVRKDIVPYLRDNQITMSAKGLKPNTQFYVFLDDVDITPFCSGGSQFTDAKGEISSITYDMSLDTDNNFLSGRRIFRITDSSTNTVSQATMAAEASYSAIGMFDSLAEDGILSTRPATVRRRSVKSSKVQSNLTDLLSTDFFGFTEPLSQTFYIDPVRYPDGIFVKQVGIAFSAKTTASNIPVTLLLKPTVSGYPHPSKVMPFGQSTQYSQDITTSTDGSTETTFSFSSPIYLLPGNEYAISLITNNSDFRVFKSTIGENIINLVDGVADRKATKQPLVRSLFLPQNTGSLTKSDIESIRFSLGLCIFSNASGEVSYVNDPENYATNTLFDLARVNISQITPTGTSITFEEDGLLDGPKFIQANKNFDRSAQSNRSFSGQFSSLTMNFIGKTYVSPVIDTQLSNYIVVRNKINNNLASTNFETYPTNYGATAANRTEARYITKQVTLEPGLEATSIRVQMSLCNPYNSSIKVYVRPLPIGEGDFTNINYTELNAVGTIGYSTNADTFREVTYTNASDLSKFRAFSVKIVMFSEDATTVGKDPRILPRIKNLRIIAT